MFIINFCLNMFRASLCPSSGDQRPCVTAYGVLRWFRWMWLVAVVGRCVVGCEHYQFLSQHVSAIIIPIFRRPKTVCYCIRFTALVPLDVVSSGCGALRCRMRALSTSVSTCFGHQYAHLQENKDRMLLHTVYRAGSAGCGW